MEIGETQSKIGTNQRTDSFLHDHNENYKFYRAEEELKSHLDCHTFSFDDGDNSNSFPKQIDKTRLKYHHNNFKTVVSTLQHNVFSNSSLETLPAVPILPTPQSQLNDPTIPINNKIAIIYRYLITGHSYNYLAEQFYDISVIRGTPPKPISALLALGNSIMACPMPIRCIEGTIITITLTQGLETHLDRVPVIFTSISMGVAYKHIVTILHYKGQYGALGFSRKENLMFKQLKFNSLWDLIIEFNNSYKIHDHELIYCDFGLPIPHIINTDNEIGCWSGFLFLDLTDNNKTESDYQKICSIFSTQWNKIHKEWKEKIGNNISLNFHNGGSEKKNNCLIKIIRKKYGLVFDKKKKENLKNSQNLQDFRSKSSCLLNNDEFNDGIGKRTNHKKNNSFNDFSPGNKRNYSGLKGKKGGSDDSIIVLKKNEK